MTLPAAGELIGTQVATRVISKAGIDNNNFAFAPAANANGDAYATFTFKVNDGTDRQLPTPTR